MSTLVVHPRTSVLMHSCLTDTHQGLKWLDHCNTFPKPLQEEMTGATVMKALACGLR